jgi:hypothetical protein
MTSGALTMAFAINCFNTVAGQIVAAKGAAAVRMFDTAIGSNVMLFRHGDGLNSYVLPNYYQINIPFTVSNQIIYVVWVKPDNNAANAKIYVDGVDTPFNIDVNGLVGLNNNTADLQIGDLPDGYFPGVAPFIGINYDLKIFNVALTPLQCDYLYRTRATRIPTALTANCVLDMRFNEKQGFAAADQSGNANNGTLQNYTVGDVTLGVGNKWTDINGNPILS